MKRMQITEAYLAMLTAVTGKTWGDAEAPGGLATPTTPYGIVYAIAGAQVEGDAADAAAMIELVYQLTTVGPNRREAEWLADRAFEATLAPSPNGGWVNSIDAYSIKDQTNAVVTRHLAADDHVAVVGRLFDSDGGDQYEGPLVSASARYRLLVTPV
jgi:hypothetical protein